MMMFRIRCAFLAGALLMVAAARAQSSFVSPHILTDSSGATQGIAWNVSGGQTLTDASGKSTYSTFDELFSLYGNDSVFKWLLANVNGTPTPATYDIYSLGKDEPLVWTATDMLPSTITLPGCDGDSKDPAGLRAVGRITFKAKEGATLARSMSEARRQKMWLPSNFRLKVGDLPCSRVTKVDAITLRRTVGDLNGDGQPDVYFVPDPFGFDVPMADAPAFQTAFQSTLGGTPIGTPIQLDYLDADGNVLLSFVMTGKMVGAGPGNLWMDPSNPSATYRVLESIQDESKGFSSLIR